MQTTSITSLVLCRGAVKLLAFRFSRSAIYNVWVGCWRDIPITLFDPDGLSAILGECNWFQQLRAPAEFHLW